MSEQFANAWSSSDELVIVPIRRPGRWIALALTGVIGVYVAWSVATNPRFQWPIVGQYLFDPTILSGLATTIWLTLLTMALGVVLGVLLAVMRLGDNPVLKAAATSFIWFFRGTPALVQLIFWYNLAALYPDYRIGIPIVAPGLLTGSVNDLITPYTAAILGLALNEAAYMAEIVRAGIVSVDPGQVEAGLSLGMTRLTVLRRIVLPQAMRFIIPPTGNETIGMLKTTSIVSVIALADLLYSAQSIYARNFATIPLLVVASLWYLVLTSLLTLAQWPIERRFNRGQRRSR